MVTPKPATAKTPIPEPATQPEPAAAQCGKADLATLPSGFAALRKAAVACGAAVSADDMFSLLESAVSAGDGEALLVMGKLYDPTAQDPDFEGIAALTLGDQPAQAAEYHSRAKTAGAAGALPLLAAACLRLATANEVLSEGAHDDFCR